MDVDGGDDDDDVVAEAQAEDEMEEDDDDDDMPVFFKELNDPKDSVAKTPARNPKSKVALVVRAKVEKVLTSTDLADKRARQCDQTDFLKLLLAFHDEGIHFS